VYLLVPFDGGFSFGEVEDCFLGHPYAMVHVAVEEQALSADGIEWGQVME
jgi:hypothetical protein